MKTLFSIAAAFFFFVSASYANPLQLATVSASYYVNQNGSLKTFTANNTAYLNLAAALEIQPKTNYVVAIDRNDGIVGVFRKSNGSRVFAIIQPTGNIGGVSNTANTDQMVVSAVNIFTPAAINTALSGGAVSRVKFSGVTGKILSQATSFHGAVNGAVMKGTVTGGAKLLFAP